MSEVTADTQIPTFVVIKDDDGQAMGIKPADDLAATMMVKAYVPEYDPDVMTFDEAFNLALLRDAQAADDLEASIMALGSNADDEAEEAAARDAINMLLETAALADEAVSGVVLGL